ncbi:MULTISPECIES: alpha/beta hydrolase [Streptomyces]|uniref:alpha/beta hydrolase n=1 Tax=Streptomyces TaxID=1883 RepID=UPI00186B3424|nr:MULTISPECIES: alpha/beta hydrolase [Streptomyces]
MPRTDVTFPSSGLTLAGHLYTPDAPPAGAPAEPAPAEPAPAEPAPAEPAPAIVVGHPMTGVKEQTAGLYARRLAERGFVALAFDAAYQGASEGEPRGLEDPFQRAEDVRNAVTYLADDPRVDAGRIGVLGICASGGYVPFAAQTDHRMRAVATVSAADVTAFFRDADPDGFRRMVEESGRLRTEEAAGRPLVTVNAVPDTVDEATPAPVREFFDYYRTPRAQHPRSTGHWLARSAELLAQYDAFGGVARIAPRPLLMIAGTRALTLRFSEGAVARAGETAELFLVEDATHVDLYDRPFAVDRAVDRLTDFFAEHLAA